MSIQPDGEEIRRAVKWIAEERQAAPQRPLKVIVEEACLKFDLSPLEAEYLLRTLKDRDGQQ